MMRSNAILYNPPPIYRPVSNNKNGKNSMAFYKPYKPPRKTYVTGLPKVVSFK
jgi:hypothetical protein